MNNTTNEYHEAALLAADQIAENFCRQIIAIQRNILTRPQGQDTPTPEETMMMVKLVNCLDKIRRFSGRTPSRKTKKETTISETPLTVVPPNTDKQPVVAAQETAPVSQQDFEDYNYILGNIGFIEDATTVKFRDTQVNAKWLQYNLFQYCLPAASRQFIHDANDVLEYVDYEVLKQNIKIWKKSLERAA